FARLAGWNPGDSVVSAPFVHREQKLNWSSGADGMWVSGLGGNQSLTIYHPNGQTLFHIHVDDQLPASGKLAIPRRIFDASKPAVFFLYRVAGGDASFTGKVFLPDFY
nr:hypothetical protein [Prolixibacteraceae bacterium]